MKNAARVQSLAVLLIAVAGWLAFDLASLKQTVLSYLDSDSAMGEGTNREEWAAPIAEAAPARAPTLIGHSVPTPDPIPLTVPLHEPISDCQAALASPAAAAKPKLRLPTLWRTKGKALIRDLKEARSLLELTVAQHVEFRLLIADAGHDLDTLRHRPNENGETWHGLQRAFVVSGRNVGWEHAHAQLETMARFARTVLRNADESYDQVRHRIIATHAGILRDRLTPEQQSTWDDYDPSPIVDPVEAAHLTPRFARTQLR